MEAFFILFIVSIGLLPAEGRSRHKRVVEGEITAPHEYPATVMLQFKFKLDNKVPDILIDPWTTYCTGVLINNSTVLSAAACMESDEYIDLRIMANPRPVFDQKWAGWNGKKRIPFSAYSGVKSVVQKRILHPLYNKTTGSYDFLILKLNKSIPIMGQRVQYARLPTEDPYPKTRTRCWLAGWGNELGYNDYLRKIELGAQPNAINSTKEKSIMLVEQISYWNLDTVFDGRPCKNDKGSPLYCWTNSGSRPILAGIMANTEKWIFSCAPESQKLKFSNVACVQKWIRENS